MAIAPLPSRRRTPLMSMLDFAAARESEANSVGDVISQLAKPILGSMGVQPQDAVQRGPVPTAQPLGTWSGPAPVVQAGETIDPSTITDPLFRNIVAQESGFQTGLVSPKGAAGPAQILPSTAVDPGFGVPSIFDLADEQGVDYSARTEEEAKRLLLENNDLNLTFGQIYKDAMANRYGGDPVLTAAAYNAGPGAVDQYGGVPPYEETQGYVANVVPGAGGTLTRSDMGGAGYGAMPQSVEGILGSLYPQQSEEDARMARRKDIYRGLSQGLSALSQGRPVDLSAIAQGAEARKRQALLDMRERERARSAAALVYQQTGDADLATGVATGAIQYSDVLSERQIKRAEELADLQRIKDAKSAAAMADAMRRTGIYDDEDIAAVAAGEVTADQIGGIYEQRKLAEELRVADERQSQISAQNVADAQYILTTVQPGSLEARAAERVIALDGEESYYDIIKNRAAPARNTVVLGQGERLIDSDTKEVIAEGLAKPADDATYQFQAEIQQRMDALGEDEATATRAVLDKAEQQGFVVTLGENGKLVSASFGGTAPAGGAGGAGAAGGELGPTAPGTATVAGPNGELQNVAVPGAVAPQQAQADLDASLFDLEQKKAAAPDEATARGLDLQIKDIELQKAELALQEAQSAQGLDQREQELRIQAAEESVKTAQAARDKTEQEAATIAAKAELRVNQREIRDADAMRLATDVYNYSKGFTKGPVAGYARGLLASMFPASEAGQAEGQLEGVRMNIFVNQLADMRESSPTGAAVGNVTEGERAALASVFGRLDIGGDPEVLQQNLRAIANASLDLKYGTPEKLRQAVKEGKLDAETAERYGARYDIKGDSGSLLKGDLGAVTPLGLVELDETILTTPEAAGRIPADSTDPDYEAALLRDPSILENTSMEDYNALSPERKSVFDRLLAEGAE